MRNKDYTLNNVEAFIGQSLGISDWHLVEQESINAFGEITRDLDPNHIDPDWAKIHSPYRRAIAFGFMTLSLLTFLCNDAGFKPEGVKEEFNYGLESVRFLAPVPAGTRIRAKTQLKEVRPWGTHNKVLKIGVEVEAEGQTKPALVADWLVMVGDRLEKRETSRVQEQSV